MTRRYAGKTRIRYGRRMLRPIKLPALTADNRKAFNREFPEMTITEIRAWINAK